MRSGDAGFVISEFGTDGTWRANVPPGYAWKKRGAFGTPFAPFRFCIPELCGYEGRAVYMDADMLVLGDVRELLETPMERGYRCISNNRTDVSVIDCGFFKDKPWWPRIAQMVPSGWVTFNYLQLLHQHGAISPTLDPLWNVCDGLRTPDPGIGRAKLLHATFVPTQPFHPYPTVAYQPHPWPSWVKAWNDTLAEARAQVSR